LAPNGKIGPRRPLSLINTDATEDASLDVIQLEFAWRFEPGVVYESQ
jgi:hypothetical protein